MALPIASVDSVIYQLFSMNVIRKIIVDKNNSLDLKFLLLGIDCVIIAHNI